MTSAASSIAVVVPAHQAAGTIEACLDALLATGFTHDEILVVDDGSRDGTGDRARAKRVGVLRNAVPRRPAEARNIGVRALPDNVGIVVFVDADVVVHPGARARIAAAFADPTLAALFGSYDDAPPAPRLVSRYRNLLHHFVHQRGRAEAATFWTGFGAVRRAEFLRLGGLHGAWEDIEDVEFGVRLREAGGRIRLDAALQATHLKDWTLRSMFRTDLKGRAIPWSRLLLLRGGAGEDLNLAGQHRVSVAMVALLIPGLLGAPLHGAFGLLAFGALAAFLVVNRDFLRFLARLQGLGFAAAAVPFHLLHYLAAGLGFAWVLVTELPGARIRPRRHPAGEAR